MPQRSDPEWREFVAKQFQGYSDTISRMEKLIEANTKLTEEAVSSSKEVVDFFNTFKTGLKIMSRIQDVALWLAKVSAAASILYAMAKWGVGQIIRDMGIIK